MIERDFDLSNAQSQYAVANTPLFLVRKLQEDTTVTSISKRLSGVQILRELEEAVSRKPDDLLHAVLPYVCLVALWMKPDSKFLRSTTRISPVYKDEWFNIARQALVQTYQPTSRQVISLPMTVTPKTKISSSAAAASIAKMEFRETSR